MINSQVSFYTLSSIFQMMENGSISAPSFGRGFVWTTESVKNLFDSVNKGYPIGPIIVIESKSDQFDRSPSEKSYFPDPSLKGFDTWKTLLVLDGSQRLAALYSVLKGKQNKIELYYDLNKREFVLDKSDLKPMNKLSMSSLFDPKDFRHLQTYLAKQKNAEELIDELHSIQRRFMDYSILIQMIPNVEDIEIIDIFKRLNNSGVSLTRQEIEKVKDYKKPDEKIGVNNLQPSLDLARLYQQQGRFIDAEAILLESLEIDSQQLQPRTELAKIYQRQNKLEKAEAVLLEILEIKPKDLQSRTELAKLYQWQNKLEKAEAVLLESLEIDSQQLHPRTELAKIYQRQGKLEKAEAVLLESLMMDPQQLHLRTELTKIYQQQNKVEKAEAVLLESLKIDSQQLQPRTELAKIYQRQNKLEKAEAVLLEILKLDTDNLQSRTELAKIYQRQGKWDEAEKISEEVLKIDPLNDHAISELIVVWEHQKEKEKCVKRFLEFIDQPNYRFSRYSQAPVFRFFRFCRAFGLKEYAEQIFERFKSELDEQNIKYYQNNFR